MTRAQTILSLISEATHIESPESDQPNVLGTGIGVAGTLGGKVGKGGRALVPGDFFPHPFLKNHYVRKKTGEIILSRKA